MTTVEELGLFFRAPSTLNRTEVEAVGAIRGAALDLATVILDYAPVGDEREEAIRAVKLATFWSGKAIDMAVSRSRGLGNPLK
jgi:hypothetical protein